MYAETPQGTSTTGMVCKKKKKKKKERKVQGVPQSQTAALPRHQEKSTNPK